MSGRTRLITLCALALTTAGAIGGAYAWPFLTVGAAYKAKMLCSGLYVSGGDPEALLADLQIDDLGSLRAVRAKVDPDAQAVTASALGLARRRAVFRAGQGCALGAGLPRMADRADDAGVEQPTSLPAISATSAELRSVLDEAFSEPDAKKPRRTRALVIVHHGVIVAERYSGTGVGPDTPLPGWSMTKSVINALTGILVAEGRLALDAPVPIADWQRDNDGRAAITLDHLLRMSSGLEFEEGMTSPRSDLMRMLFGATDAAAYAAHKPLAAAPGARWQYSSGSTNIIAGLIRSVMTDDREYRTFPTRALFEPIGMRNTTIETDASGTFVGSSFMYATARDWARFGMLYLQDGIWHGRRILPEAWVKYTTTPAPANPEGNYGAHFWLDVPAEYRHTIDDLPPDAIHAVGHEAQFVTVIPSRELVIVRLGRTRYPGAWDHVGFVKRVINALGG